MAGNEGPGPASAAHSIFNSGSDIEHVRSRSRIPAQYLSESLRARQMRVRRHKARERRSVPGTSELCTFLTPTPRGTDAQRVRDLQKHCSEITVEVCVAGLGWDEPVEGFFLPRYQFQHHNPGNSPKLSINLFPVVYIFLSSNFKICAPRGTLSDASSHEDRHCSVALPKK